VDCARAPISSSSREASEKSNGDAVRTGGPRTVALMPRSQRPASRLGKIALLVGAVAVLALVGLVSNISRAISNQAVALLVSCGGDARKRFHATMLPLRGS
jgi:hypothetical protein